MKKLIRNNNLNKVEIVLEKNINTKFADAVLVKVKTVGLCRTDLFVAQGLIAKDKEKIVLGHEFCGEVLYDEKNLIKEGTLVGFNPLVNKEFMGLDFDGALSEEIWIPRSHVVIVKENTKLSARDIAYLEPVAASAAALKVLTEKSKILIIGKNRISILTSIILESYGHEVVLLNENNLSDIADDSFEYVLETVLTDSVVSNISRILKEGGTWILKSRKKTPTSFISTDFISKEINIRTVNYYDFNKTLDWMENNVEKFQFLLGKEYEFGDWENAFSDALSNETHKIFIKVS